MLTLLFALAAVWSLFWFVMLTLDWDEYSTFAHPKAVCAKCAGNFKKADTSAQEQSRESQPAVKPVSTVVTPITSTAPAQNNESNVTPLFVAPAEKDDLKIIKGIGVVMEKTLNDLGITTFKQLANFDRADIQMVSDVLSESNAGFGDRIDRDEWVPQAAVFANKAA